MKVTKASQKFNVTRHQIDYWRRTGLLSNQANQDGSLAFDDLLKLKFIIDCKRNSLSLQKIRNYIRWNIQTGPAGEDHWRSQLKVPMIGPIPGEVFEEEGRLVNPMTGQLYFDYNPDAESTGKSKIVSFRKNLTPADQEERLLESLEVRFQEALAQGDRKLVTEILKEILAITPEHLGALIEMGNLAFEAQEYDDAIEFYELALKITPHCVEAIYNLANLYFKQKKFSVAIRYYQMSIDLDPDFSEAYYNLALVYYSLKFPEKALSLFEYYLRLDPDSSWRHQAEQFIEDIEQILSEQKEEQNPTLFDRESTY